MELSPGTTILVRTPAPSFTPVYHPKGEKGDTGAPGGSDAATADQVSNGALTKAALSATIAAVTDPIEADVAAIPDTIAADISAERNPWRTSRALDAMATPRFDDRPTVSWANSETATTLTTPATYRPSKGGIGSRTTGWNGQDDPNFRFFSGSFETFNGANQDLAVNGELKPDGSAQFARWPVVFSFTTSAGVDKLELGFFGRDPANAHAVLIEVNGAVLDDTAIRTPTTYTGSGSTLTLTFPTKRGRTIRIWTNGGMGFYQLRIPTAETITKPAMTGKRLAIIGDSYVNGAGFSYTYPDQGTNNLETFAPRLGRMLGAGDIILAGVGATGFTTTGKYANRTDEVVAMTPDTIVFNGSINDGTGAGTVQTEVAAALALCSGVPHVYVIGVLLNGYSANHEAVRAATVAAGRTFIDMQDFLYGTGKVTAPTGDGNRDVFLQADGAHPTLGAHRAIARKAFALITQQAWPD